MTVQIEAVLAVIAGVIFFIVVFAGGLSRLSITEPLFAVVAGIAIAVVAGGPVDSAHPATLTFLELALALVLFGDAARIDIRKLREQYRWPARMLTIGLPLAIVVATLVGNWLLVVPVGGALLLGVILAPTDAALAAPVLENRALPVRIRQALNVEAGLNDGLALPALFIALGLLEMEEGAQIGQGLQLMVQQIGMGLLGGLSAGLFGAWVIRRATNAGWMDRQQQKMAVIALALATFAVVQLLGGSGFVATFVAGGVLGSRTGTDRHYLYEFAEIEGRVMVLIAFVFIGAGPIYMLFETNLPWQVWAMALGSLFVVRPLAIALSLIGERLIPSTVIFFGWFGPRGLATVVFLLVALEEVAEVPAPVVAVTYLTVALSVLLHGLTARPMARWCESKIMAVGDESMPEMGEAHEHPMR